MTRASAFEYWPDSSLKRKQLADGSWTGQYVYDMLLVAYCGRSLSDESPTLIFPNGFRPSEYIFNAHNVHEGLLALVREPLQVLKAHEGGIDNVVAFLTEIISPIQLEMLASLMDQRSCEALELY